MTVLIVAGLLFCALGARRLPTRHAPATKRDELRLRYSPWRFAPKRWQTPLAMDVGSSVLYFAFGLIFFGVALTMF